MSYELKFFLVKLVTLLALTPILGYGLFRYFEYFEQVWKTNNRRKKWLITCGLFFILACLGGFLQ
jgi:hypothetical protein